MAGHSISEPTEDPSHWCHLPIQRATDEEEKEDDLLDLLKTDDWELIILQQLEEEQQARALPAVDAVDAHRQHQQAGAGGIEEGGAEEG